MPTSVDSGVDTAEWFELVVFTLDGQLHALRLSAVERVVRAVEIAHLPKAPDIVLGMVNVQGRILPVVDVRRKFGTRSREIEPSDQFILVQTSGRSVALSVDSVQQVVVASASQVVPADDILDGLDHVVGVLKLDDGMVVVHDLEGFLSRDEELAVDEAMTPKASGQ